MHPHNMRMYQLHMLSLNNKLGAWLTREYNAHAHSLHVLVVLCTCLASVESTFVLVDKYFIGKRSSGNFFVYIFLECAQGTTIFYP